MPHKKLIKKRGGTLRVRTKRLSKRSYGHVHVTRKTGPRGGRTVVCKHRYKKKA